MQSYPSLLALPTPINPPIVIFLDAVGTLFRVQGSVGQIYQQFACQYGVDCSAADIDREFYRQFTNAPPGKFTGHGANLAAQEYSWWREINRQTFLALQKFQDFTDFEAFFAELYAFFATPAAWELYPDTIPILTQWHQQGIPLEIISNFDSRLYPVLTALGLQRYFQAVTISTAIGTAKPDPIIFTKALAGRAAAQAWHIGDSWDEDYQGASAAGLQAFWLKRI